jgi:hypothetical protein
MSPWGAEQRRRQIDRLLQAARRARLMEVKRDKPDAGPVKPAPRRRRELDALVRSLNSGGLRARTALGHIRHLRER